MSSSSTTKTSMWQTEDDSATCDVADDVDVSFHMLSHKVRGTKIKKQNSQRDQTQKFIDNFIFLPFPFFIIFNTSSSNFIENIEKPKNSSINININITALEIHQKFLWKPHLAWLGLSFYPQPAKICGN